MNLSEPSVGIRQGERKCVSAWLARPFTLRNRANFDPAVVQSTEELESSIMEQMNALVS